MKTNNEIKVGDLVKFVNDLDGDNVFKIEVIELRGDRVLIKTHVWESENNFLNPTQNVLLSEIYLVD